jgi:osmotically-inducible protein OsmY
MLHNQDSKRHEVFGVKEFKNQQQQQQKENVQMKTIRLVAMLAAVAALLMTSALVHATMDSRIESSAKQSYLFRTYLQDDDIKVESRDGAVTLTGIVADNFNKSLAQETVAGLPGVKSGDNRLEVKGAPPTANSDAWLRDKVRGTLLFHRSVSARTTSVDVKDGIVTLRGNAANQAQKELTTEYAKDVEGIKDVKNEMTVTKASKKQTIGEKIDDASITTQVKMMLLYHRSTSALHTSVTTNDGMVTLVGNARNAAEVDMVTKLARDVDGVTGVNNRMTIE